MVSQKRTPARYPGSIRSSVLLVVLTAVGCRWTVDQEKFRFLMEAASSVESARLSVLPREASTEAFLAAVKSAASLAETEEERAMVAMYARAGRPLLDHMALLTALEKTKNPLLEATDAQVKEWSTAYGVEPSGTPPVIDSLALADVMRRRADFFLNNGRRLYRGEHPEPPPYPGPYGSP